MQNPMTMSSLILRTLCAFHCGTLAENLCVFTLSLSPVLWHTDRTYVQTMCRPCAGAPPCIASCEHPFPMARGCTALLHSLVPHTLRPPWLRVVPCASQLCVNRHTLHGNSRNCTDTRHNVLHHSCRRPKNIESRRWRGGLVRATQSCRSSNMLSPGSGMGRTARWLINWKEPVNNSGHLPRA